MDYPTKVRMMTGASVAALAERGRAWERGIAREVIRERIAAGDVDDLPFDAVERLNIAF
jgi:uncharacterized membrane protein